jgi:hypothetical protein
VNASDDSNPYHSSSSTTEPVRRRTRWRICVVTLLLIFGFVGLMATPIPLFVASARRVELGGGITYLRVAGVLLNAIGSSLWIASGFLCWRGRWTLAIAGVSLGVLAMFGGNQLLADLDL